MTKLDLSSLTHEQAQMAQQIMSSLNVHYQTELLHMLLDIYHKHLHDMLTPDVLEEYATRHGIGLQEEYLSRHVELDEEEM